MSSMKARTKLSGRTAAAWLIFAALVALVGIAFAVWSTTKLDSATNAESAAKADLARETVNLASSEEDSQTRIEEARRIENEANRAQAELEAKRDSEEFWTIQGYESLGSGVFLRWLDFDDFSCGRYSCLAFSAIAEDGCPSGLYLEAAITSGGAQVGWTNETFSALAPGEWVNGVFEDIYGEGDSFKVTKSNCR